MIGALDDRRRRSKRTLKATRIRPIGTMGTIDSTEGWIGTIGTMGTIDSTEGWIGTIDTSEST